MMAQTRIKDKMIETGETLSTPCRLPPQWRDRKAPDNRCK
jgi:hypothetical protein